MKTVFTLFAAALAFSVQAAGFDPDWSAHSANSKKVYTILPNTATIVAASGNRPSFVTVMGEFRETPEAAPERFRLGVTGCENPQLGGRVVFASPDGGKVLMKHDWVEGGGRVYDALALGACNAMELKQGSQQTPAPTPAPARRGSFNSTI